MAVRAPHHSPATRSTSGSIDASAPTWSSRASHDRQHAEGTDVRRGHDRLATFGAALDVREHAVGGVGEAVEVESRR